MVRTAGGAGRVRSTARPLHLAVGVSLAALLLGVACGSPGGTTAPPGSPSVTPQEGGAAGTPVTAVEIKLFTYQPQQLEVRPGTSVTWRNGDAIEHSVTSGTPAEPDTTFDSGLFPEGNSYTFTFSRGGEFPYFCTRHPSMRGSVRVRADME